MLNLNSIREQELELVPDVSIHLRRFDLIHSDFGGNKWFKLWRNIESMRREGKKTMTSLGGSHSNHIAALAAAGEEYGFQTVGIIRGEKHSASSPTLVNAGKCGMRLLFPGRESYDEMKNDPVKIRSYTGIQQDYLLPEGGGNLQAAEGCVSMLENAEEFKLICCGVGTGTTQTGLILASKSDREIIGFSAMAETEGQQAHVKTLLSQYRELHGNISNSVKWQILPENEFGGFAKMDFRLFDFVQNFRSEHGVQLDYIYNGKMLFKLKEMIEEGKIDPKFKILVIHTGGTQGNAAMEKR